MTQERFIDTVLAALLVAAGIVLFSVVKAMLWLAGVI